MATSSPIVSITAVRQVLQRHWMRWLLPALGMGALAAAYAAWRPDTWEASQALLLRNDVASSELGPGKFRHEDEMKTNQETVLELVSSQNVLQPALLEVGPPDNCPEPELWPTDEDLQRFRAGLQLTPPKGAEFGKTEVFYLKVKSRERERALALAKSVCDQLQTAVGRLLDAKAASMEEELVKLESLAQQALDESTQELSRLEVLVAGDLSELRMLHQSPAGDSDLHRAMTTTHSELLAMRTAQSTNEQLIGQLQAARRDPQVLIATPPVLLESLPELKRLKDGLLDTQLRTSGLLGVMTEVHPSVVSARQAETAIHERIFTELEVATRAVEANQQLVAARLAVLDERLQADKARLAQLAKIRATYTNLANQVDHRRGVLEATQRKLTEVRMGRTAAATGSLITRVDRPQGGPRPLGPSRATLAAGGLLGGLLFGLGWLVLTVPLAPLTRPSTPSRLAAATPEAGPPAGARVKASGHELLRDLPERPRAASDRYSHPVHS